MKIKLFLFSFSLFILYSCAHENGGIISLQNINTVKLKTIFDFEISGFDSEGNELTASISLINSIYSANLFFKKLFYHEAHEVYKFGA